MMVLDEEEQFDDEELAATPPGQDMGADIMDDDGLGCL